MLQLFLYALGLEVNERRCQVFYKADDLLACAGRDLLHLHSVYLEQVLDIIILFIDQRLMFPISTYFLTFSLIQHVYPTFIFS